jgi:hypothetical protein
VTDDFQKTWFFGFGSDYDKHKANLSRTAVNLQRGLNEAAWCERHERQQRAVSTKHCPQAKRKPKVGSKQQIQPVPKLRSSPQRH